MVAAQLVAYPILLAAIYGVFRVGRAEGRFRQEAFEWVRVAVLGAFLGVVCALQVRLATGGWYAEPIALFGGAMAIAAVFGLIGLNVLHIVEARQARTTQ